MEVLSECSACGGTGLYHGIAEPRGVAVVCLRCNGTGAVKIIYTPFTGRRLRTDVQQVQLSRGTLIFGGCGPMGRSISYEEFVAGKMPEVER